MNQKLVPPLISTPRLLIRPHQKGDEVLLNRALADSYDQLHKWMDWAVAPLTMKQTQEYIEFSQKCWKEEVSKDLPLLIFDSTETKLIGSTGFLNVDWSVRCFEIGYWINVQYASQGFITEAVNALARYAFASFDARRVEIRCDTDNIKSANIPRKLNFLLEAHFKNHRIKPDSQKISDTLIFAIYDAESLPPLY